MIYTYFRNTIIEKEFHIKIKFLVILQLLSINEKFPIGKDKLRSWKLYGLVKLIFIDFFWS